MRNRASDRRIPRSDALPLSHRDSTVSEVYYEVHMTRVLHTVRINYFDLNRIREMVSFELDKEMLSAFRSRKSIVRAKNLCHNGGCAGHFLELPGRYQSSREGQNSVPRKRCDLTLEKKGHSSNVSTSNFLLSIYEVREERKSVSLDVTIKTTKVNREVKLLCSKKKIMTCCLSCHFIKVPRRRRHTTPIPVKTLNQFLPKTHHEFSPHFPIRAKQIKRKQGS